MSANVAPETLKAVNEWSSGFFQLMTPDEILTRSTDITQSVESAKLLSSTLLFGERTGFLSARPYDSSGVSNQIKNLSDESLWIYGSINHPEDFTPVEEKGFTISTGKVYKCGTCRGRGLVVCTNCNGKGWVKDSEGRMKDCSWCSGGTNNCSTCDGYGMLEQIIRVSSKYKLATHHSEDYQGDVPKTSLEKSSGVSIFDETIDYPEDIQAKLVGGIDEGDFSALQCTIKQAFHEKIDTKLETYDGDKKLVHDLVDEFFNQMPNPATANKVLEYEIYPVRLRVKIEDAPVYQIDYKYQDKPYSVWVYGKEKKIYAPIKPRKLTWKLGVFMVGVISLLALLVFVIANYS